MGRSRVYCTRPVNANRQHNTKTARPIPRDRCMQETLSRQPLDARQSVNAYLLRVPDHGPRRGPQARDLDR